MTDSLRYPHDRVNGYVQLTDGNGNLYVPDRRPTSNGQAADAMKYAGAFLILASRVVASNQIEARTTEGT
jgi:hypothetical protein